MKPGSEKVTAPKTQPSLKNPPMEVHPHGHVHSDKKWKEYLFQFLMLFIAITLGFLVENQRDHYLESVRAEELGKTLYEELRSDSVNLDKVIVNRLNKEQHISYVADYIKDSSLTNLPPAFYPHFTWALFMSTYIIFEPKDGMLEQLKNSGSLRYFRNIEIQKAVGDYSVALNNLRKRMERENDLLNTVNRDMLLKYYDHSWNDKVTKNGELATADALNNYDGSIPAKILNAGSMNREEVYNYLVYYKIVLRSTRNIQMRIYKEESKKLTALLKKEYSL
jgi:hypothetical protein